MLKKRSFMIAELDPPPLVLPNAVAPESVKKQRSVHFGAIEVLDGVPEAPVSTQIVQFNLEIAERRFQEGARAYSSMVVKNIQRGDASPLELEHCRDRLETLRIATEVAVHQKLHIDILETKRLFKEYIVLK